MAADKIEAHYEKGVLTITCPKKEVVKPKAIAIKSKKSETLAEKTKNIKAAKPKPAKKAKPPRKAKLEKKA